MNSKKLVLIPTRYCNFSCDHCGVKLSKNKDYISLSKVKKILKIAKLQRYEELFITGGGEPTINWDKLIKILRLAKKYGLDTTLITNGSFSLKDEGGRLRELRCVGLKNIKFSVDLFHLEFIPYRLLLKEIRCALRLKMNVYLGMYFSKKNQGDTLKILKRIAGDLDGKLIKIPPLLDNSSKYVLLTKHGLVSVTFGRVERTEENKGRSNFNFKRITIERLLFKPHPPKAISVDLDGRISPCYSFNSINNPELYVLGHLDDKKVNNEFYVQDPFFYRIICDRLGFLKFFLRIRKDKELKDIFHNKIFYSKCDFCLLLLEYRERIMNLPSVSKSEIIKYLLFHFPYFIIGSLEGAYYEGVNYLAKKIRELLSHNFQYSFERSR